MGLDPSLSPTPVQLRNDGARSAEFALWIRHAIIYLQTVTFLNFTALDVARGMDIGGVGVGAPALPAGNANAINAASEQHTARLVKCSGIVIELNEKECNLQINLENVLLSFSRKWAARMEVHRPGVHSFTICGRDTSTIGRRCASHYGECFTCQQV